MTYNIYIYSYIWGSAWHTIDIQYVFGEQRMDK